MSPLRYGVLIVLLCGPVPTRAAQVGTIFSGPTSGDAASVHHNPAAMTLLRGTHGLFFGAVSAIRLHYQRDTPSPFDNMSFPRADTFVAKPNIAMGIVTDATLESFRFGVGMTIPIIDGASWLKEYDGKPSSTRYYAINARLVHLLIEFAAAYRINKYISVGVGLDVINVMLDHEVMTDFGAKVNQMACAMNSKVSCPMNAPFARENPGLDGLTTLGGSGWSAGAFAGILVTPTSWLSIGAGFHSGGGLVKIPVDLAVEIPPDIRDYVAKNLPSLKIPPLQAEGAVETASPMTLSVGITISPSERLRLSADLYWMNTSETTMLVGHVTKKDALELIGDQVMIKTRGDSFLVGLRGTYRLLDNLNTALRFEYDANTRPDRFITPVSVDFHKFSFHLGVSWRATSWLEMTLEYGHYFLLEREIEDSRFAPNASPTTPEEEGFDHPSPSGRYFIEVDRVGVGMLLSF